MPPSNLNKKHVTLQVRNAISSNKLTAPRRHKTIIPPEAEEKPRQITSRLYPSLVLVSFLLGVLSSYAAWGRRPQIAAVDFLPVAVSTNASNDNDNAMDFTALMKQVNPPAGYNTSVQYGDLGPRLIEGGAIDFDAFAAVYENAGDALTQSQIETLKQGSDEQIVITAENAHYLLNFFWAVGLFNKNKILTEGPMVQNSGGRIENFASTGGWTLGTKPVSELYASMELILLTAEQQARVEEVASGVFRPCCNNPTLFPDCNHGMAMLGLLELMASQDASVDEMFTAAKYVNAYWFPQQALETAVYFKANQDIDFAQTDPRLVTGKDFFSASGARKVNTALQADGLLPQAPGSGGSCAS